MTSYPMVSSSNEYSVQHGQQYGSITASGETEMHVGNKNIINHYYTYSETAQSSNRYNILYDSLSFDRMDARRRNVAAALPSTCEWLMHHPSFIAWTDVAQLPRHNGFLWIKGKPGSGKSTIMKETLTWAERRWSSMSILSYFFNARSPLALEKSALGLYRSLLHQLLSLEPRSHDLFARRFHSKVQNSKGEDAHVEEWTVTELQNFLVELVSTLSLSNICVFVDALDEGDDVEVRAMVKFFERLAQSLSIASLGLRICLSSRHYPHITVKKGLELVVEHQREHARDIETYIYTELASEDDPLMDQLRHKVSRRSNGVFLWVVLITTILNKLHDQGGSLSAMLQKLDETPSDLHLVFSQILQRDLQGMDNCAELLRWVLFSLRPITPHEAYSAVQTDTWFRQADQVLVPSAAIVDKFLLHCSRGLVETTKSEPQTLQFIHESVRNYLLEEHDLGYHNSRIHTPPHALPRFSSDDCHMWLAETCLQYLLHVCTRQPTTLEELSKHPLACYTAEYWWQHLKASGPKADDACRRKVLELSKKLLWGKYFMLPWVQLYDMLLPTYGVLFVRGEQSLCTPLQYATMIGVPELVATIYTIDSGIHKFGNRTTVEPPLHIAAAANDCRILATFIGEGANLNCFNHNEETAIQTALRHRSMEAMKLLLDAGADVNVKSGQGKTALHIAVHYSEEMMKLLVGRGANVDAQDAIGQTALYTCSRHGYQLEAESLIKAGAKVDLRNRQGSPALHIASIHGHTSIVRLLLDAGADAKSMDNEKRSTLEKAATSNRQDIVSLLLEQGADPNTMNRNRHTPLRLASKLGRLQVVRQLLMAGADPSSAVTATVRSDSDNYNVVDLQLDVDDKEESELFEFEGDDDKYMADLSQILPSVSPHLREHILLRMVTASMEDRDTAGAHSAPSRDAASAPVEKPQTPREFVDTSMAETRASRSTDAFSLQVESQKSPRRFVGRFRSVIGRSKKGA